jgi:cytochrome c oxidase assembly protein subunit 11
VKQASTIGGARVHTWTDEEAAVKLASLKPVQGAELMKVRLDTTVGDVLPWTFEPIQRDIKVVPGETALCFFRVTNHSTTDAITGVATYNVHPPKLGLYFQKIQCFCFEEQRLLPGETVDMPVFFFIDPEVLNDSQVAYIRNVTLSYTFFPTNFEYYSEDDEEEGDKEDHSKEEKKAA